MKSVRKAGMILGAVIFCVILPSGCGEAFPVLTQAEYDLIVDYSAGVLSKYNTGNGDKLTRVAPEAESPAKEDGDGSPSEAPRQKEPKDDKGQTPKDGAAGSSAASSEEDAESVAEGTDEENATSAEAPEEAISEEEATREDAEPSGEDAAEAVDAEDVIEASEEADDGNVADSGADDAVAIGGDDLLQKMQSGLAVSFNGYYVLNTYPDNAAGGTVLSADPGNKLLVLSFSLRNETDGTIDIDLLNADPTFTLLLNGQPVSKNLVTLLDNDMSTFMGSLSGGASTGAVLCFQVKESQAKAIDTLNLKMNYRGQEQILKIE